MYSELPCEECDLESDPGFWCQEPGCPSRICQACAERWGLLDFLEEQEGHVHYWCSHHAQI